MSKDYRKYDKLLSDVKALGYRIEQQFCVCHEAYIGRGLIDPRCQAHDISEHILEWVEAQAQPNNHFQPMAQAVPHKAQGKLISE